MITVPQNMILPALADEFVTSLYLDTLIKSIKVVLCYLKFPCKINPVIEECKNSGKCFSSAVSQQLACCTICPPDTVLMRQTQQTQHLAVPEAVVSISPFPSICTPLRMLAPVLIWPLGKVIQFPNLAEN